MRESDGQLIRRYLGGETDAAEAVTRWIRGAAATFRSRLGEDWEDAVQEAQLETARLLRADKFRGESGLVTYVWRITIRRCIELLNRRRPGVPLAETLRTPDRSPVDLMVEAEKRRMVRSVIENMPADCVQLWRRVAAGDSYQTLSIEMGVSEGALRVRALRCRQRAIEMRDRMAQPERKQQ
ncbi:MAG: sigma-70 family RNA polymerase sigma factor [Acidobacteria bacterium]|nr:sigma-70 family RNA polymerase sigma factor [Acidobacteriota bacterium]